MSLAEYLGFAVLLVGLVAFAAKLTIENSEPLDIFAIIAIAIAVGFMGNKL